MISKRSAAWAVRLAASMGAALCVVSCDDGAPTSTSQEVKSKSAPAAPVGRGSTPDVSVKKTLSLRCAVSGTKLDGSRPKHPFEETVFFEQYGKSGGAAKDEGWGLMSQSKVTSDGVEIKSANVTQGSDYLLVTFSGEVGTGFNKRLLSFTSYIDVPSGRMERIVNTFPQSPEERTVATCVPERNAKAQN